MEQNETYDLPEPTSQTINGPWMQFGAFRLEIQYDSADPRGVERLVKISFQNVIAFEFRQEALCTSEDLAGYNKVVKYVDSEWLVAFRHRWQAFLGNQASRSNEFRFFHWKIYFDDMGCVDVIAEKYIIS